MISTQVLNQTALDHMANGVLVLRCLTILGHLAFNNDEVIGYEMEVNVPYTLKWALQQHILDAKLVEIAVFTCSSLLTENEEQKAYVCDQLTPEFVEALKLYAAEASFFTKTMRCMGNMSIVDACILTMTAAGSVPLVVAGMDVHMDDSKVLRTAVELFSNFGATEDDDMDEQATTYLIDGGAIGAIKKVLAEHASANDATLLTACFDALSRARGYTLRSQPRSQPSSQPGRFWDEVFPQSNLHLRSFDLATAAWSICMVA